MVALNLRWQPCYRRIGLLLSFTILLIVLHYWEIVVMALLHSPNEKGCPLYPRNWMAVCIADLWVGEIRWGRNFSVYALTVFRGLPDSLFPVPTFKMVLFIILYLLPFLEAPMPNLQPFKLFLRLVAARLFFLSLPHVGPLGPHTALVAEVVGVLLALPLASSIGSPSLHVSPLAEFLNFLPLPNLGSPGHGYPYCSTYPCF